MTAAVSEPLLKAPTLPPIQEQILHALRAGQTYGDVAEATGLTFDTIKSHGRKLFRALGATSAASAVAAAYDCGLLRPPARQPEPMGTALERELLGVALAVSGGSPLQAVRPLARRALVQARAEGRIR